MCSKKKKRMVIYFWLGDQSGALRSLPVFFTSVNVKGHRKNIPERRHHGSISGRAPLVPDVATRGQPSTVRKRNFLGGESSPMARVNLSEEGLQ